VTLSTVAALHVRLVVVCSWKLDSSSAHTSGSWLSSSRRASSSSADGAMFPATATLGPQRSTSRAVSRVVVVLPLVPVMPITRGS
jgi:hypothetical protein